MIVGKVKGHGTDDAGRGDILDKLDAARIVFFALEAGNVIVREQCDAYYFALLDKEDMDALIGELQLLRARMK